MKIDGKEFKDPKKQAAYDAITGGRSLGTGQWTSLGMYGGNEYDLYNSPSGLKVGSEHLRIGEIGFEKNFDSAFGSKVLKKWKLK